MIFRLIQVRSVEGMRRVHALGSNDAAGFIPFTIITTVRSGFTVFLVTTVTPYGVDSRFFLCELLIPSLRRGGRGGAQKKTVQGIAL